MTTGLVVDTSVAVKWLIPEAGSDLAAKLQDYRLHAPDLLYVECCNVLWRLCRTGAVSVDEAQGLFADLRSIPIAITPCADLEVDALALACELGHPVYDCHYPAMAVRNGQTLVTEDLRFLSVARRHPVYRANVATLAETVHPP